MRPSSTDDIPQYKPWCWHCWKNLALDHKTDDTAICALVVDPIGNVHRVHKTCVKDAVAEGNKEMKA